MITSLALAGCADYPADLNGKPLDRAISLYGQPVAAVDYQGARVFSFAPDAKERNKQQRVKDLLNPDMPILESNYKPNSCIYTFNALYTGAYSEWIIHSVNQSPLCGKDI